MIKQFLRDKSGNFGTMLALAALPVMLSIGMAVDYTAVSRHQNIMQNQLDAALLSVGKEIHTLSEAELKTRIEEFLLANAGPVIYAQINNLQITHGNNRQSLTANAQGSMKTSFMMLAGVNDIDYDVEAQIRAGLGSLEVALVLDATTSMNANSKLADLKVAATNFTETLMPQATGGDTKIGIVPFAQYVNVGLHNRNAPWLELPQERVVYECRKFRDVLSKTNCRNEPYLLDGALIDREVCDITWGPVYEKCGNVTYGTWRGCVGSRQRPLNLEDRDFFTKKVPGIPQSCSAPITPLTDRRQDVLDEIGSMVAQGWTYVPAGLTWGLRVLSSHVPFAEGATNAQSQAGDITKVLVLMTDGDNQVSADLPDDPTHGSKDLAQANDWTLEACDIIKNEGVTVFTMTFGGDVSAATRDLIQQCATNPNFYYHAPTGADLDNAFQSVAAELSNLYLSM